jgi:hypothetical protein
MESLAFENPRCKDPLMHIILSWREMELPTNEQIDEAVKITLRELTCRTARPSGSFTPTPKTGTSTLPRIGSTRNPAGPYGQPEAGRTRPFRERLEK